jgi:hypothetical protein
LTFSRANEQARRFGGAITGLVADRGNRAGNSPLLIVSVLLALGLEGCGGGSDDSRERAIEQSRDAFETARRQGHDMKRAPCIYYPNGPDGSNTWFAVVVFPGDDSPRAAAVAAGCPGAKTLGYVALNESGEVIEVRGIPEG